MSNNVKPGIKHWGLFSKLAARIGAYCIYISIWKNTR